MYLLAKSSSHKSYGNGDINFYISSSSSDEDNNELFAASDLKPKVLLAIEKLREKKKRPDISIVTYSWQKTETCTSNLIESAINKLIEQKGIVKENTQKLTESEYPCKFKTENQRECIEQGLRDKHFDEIFSHIQYNIEATIPTREN